MSRIPVVKVDYAAAHEIVTKWFSMLKILCSKIFGVLYCANFYNLLALPFKNKTSSSEYYKALNIVKTDVKHLNRKKNFKTTCTI